MTIRKLKDRDAFPNPDAAGINVLQHFTGLAMQGILANPHVYIMASTSGGQVGSFPVGTILLTPTAVADLALTMARSQISALERGEF